MSPRTELKEAMLASLQARLPVRHVKRSLVDIASVPEEEHRDGVVCLVAEGGGDFANWQGREGELGTVNMAAVGLVLVGADSDPVAVEDAEDALLEDLLAWCGDWREPPIDSIWPGDYSQSRQLEHPYGWVVLKLKVRFV